LIDRAANRLIVDAQENLGALTAAIASAMPATATAMHVSASAAARYFLDRQLSPCCA